MEFLFYCHGEKRVIASVHYRIFEIYKPKEKYIFDKISYEHPILDKNALMGQSQIETIQGKGNIWHAGAWMRYGFHEDGIISGLNIAEKLGCKCPWSIKNRDIKKILQPIK